MNLQSTLLILIFRMFLTDIQLTGFVLLPIALIGFISNWTAVIILNKLPAFRHSFGFLSSSQTIADAIHSTLFLIYFCPMVIRFVISGELKLIVKIHLGSLGLHSRSNTRTLASTSPILSVFQRQPTPQGILPPLRLLAPFQLRTFSSNPLGYSVKPLLCGMDSIQVRQVVQ